MAIWWPATQGTGPITSPYWSGNYFPTAATTTTITTTDNNVLLWLYLAQQQASQQQAFANQHVQVQLAQQILRGLPPMQPPPQAPAVHDSSAAARKVAHELLLSFLTPEQRAEFAQAGHFHIRASSGRLYRIQKGIAGNILELKGGAAHARLCCHADYAHGMPDYDHMLAQLLALNDNEEHFRRVANFSPIR